VPCRRFFFCGRCFFHQWGAANIKVPMARSSRTLSQGHTGPDEAPELEHESAPAVPLRHVLELFPVWAQMDLVYADESGSTDIESHTNAAIQHVTGLPAIEEGSGLVEPEGRLPSLGSQLHASGNCAPCRFAFEGRACTRGEQCNFCHLHGHEKRDRPSKAMRDRAQRRQIRAERKQQQEQQQPQRQEQHQQQQRWRRWQQEQEQQEQQREEEQQWEEEQKQQQQQQQQQQQAPFPQPSAPLRAGHAAAGAQAASSARDHGSRFQ